MERAQKAEWVEELKGLFADSGVVVFATYAGLTVAEMTALRVRLAAAGAGLQVVKNRLAKLALEGHPGAAAADMLKGPVVVAHSVDVIAATKVAAAFAKENDKFKLIGGFMGATVLNEEGVKALATLPSLDELRGKIIGVIQAPASKIASILQAPGAQVARVLQAYADKAAA